MTDKQEAASNAAKERPILFSGAMVRALLDGSKTQTRRLCKPMNAWIEQGCREVRMVNGSAYHFLKGADHPLEKLRSPYGQPGDRLWVRETWQYADWTEDGLPWIGYSADASKQIAHYVQNDSDGWGERLYDIWADLSRPENYDIDGRAADRRWRPSIHMPRWASRILLEIVSVRVERLQDISEADADAEGCERLDSERYERDWKLCPKCGGTRLHRALGPGGGVIEDVDCVECDTYVKRYRHLWESINGPESWEANPWVWVVEFKRVTP